MSILCRFGIHKWGMMRVYRLAPSNVYRQHCERCGKKESQ